MAATLIIRDGDPHWWNSPDIWTVPESDPNGAPGAPITGFPAYMWARTRNTGDKAVTGARVDFYWSNPATGVLRSNSHFIGSAFVDLEPGEMQDVLCLTPWIPEIVNNGHECVVAEIVHPADPLPAPPPDAFDPPTFRQIAQKNLTVLVAMRSMLTRMIQVAAPKRIGGRATVFVEVGGEIDDQSLAQLGLKGFAPADLKMQPVLSLEGGCDETGEQSVDLELKPGQARAVYLKVPPIQIDYGQYAAINVVSKDATGITGGITFLLISQKGD